MVLYKKLEQFEYNTLQENDVIDFSGIRYLVTKNSLISCWGECNDKIFITLGINDKYEFCSIHYGYEALGNRSVPKHFPASRLNDFEALTRVAFEIMKLCLN
jgi:hypothetical protein